MNNQHKNIEQTLPEGQLADRLWFKKKGLSRPRIDYALRAGKIEAVGRGIYRRPGPQLKWQQVVYSLNEMGNNVHVCGRSALELQGFSHYLPIGDVQRIDLYGSKKIPVWIQNVSDSFKFEAYTRRLFEKIPDTALTVKPFGAWDWPIPFSSPELAMVELLASVQDAADFSTADKLFESAFNLRPDVVHDTLIACNQVKAKRLFLWFADRHAHSWRQVLASRDIDLGKGKRMIVKGGAYDAVYKITIPREMAVTDANDLF